MPEEKEHLVSPMKYVQVLIALMVLLVLTIAMAFINIDNFARAHHLGAGWNTAVALTIAVMKGLFILLIFMHVRYATRLTWVFAAAGFIWLMIMLSLTLTDYLTRHRPAHSSSLIKSIADVTPAAESEYLPTGIIATESVNLPTRGLRPLAIVPASNRWSRA